MLRGKPRTTSRNGMPASHTPAPQAAANTLTHARDSGDGEYDDEDAERGPLGGHWEVPQPIRFRT
jgi:hypothetical protein